MSLVVSGYYSGTDLYSLVLELPVAAYADVETQRDALESEILDRIRIQTRVETNEAVSEVVIAPQAVEDTAVRPEESTEPEADSEPIPAFWQPGYFRLFISHLSEDRAKAHALKAAIAQFQVAAFVAHDDIEPSAEWQSEIEGALRTMDAMAAMLTPEFVHSPWCDQEVGYALGRRRFVLGLRMGADPHGFLGRFQGLQVSGLDPASAAARIFDVLITNEVTTQRLTESIVERLVRSSSWDASKRTMTLLEKASFLNEGQVARLLNAIEDNIDVGDAFGVPGRIRSLIARIGESSS